MSPAFLEPRQYIYYAFFFRLSIRYIALNLNHLKKKEFEGKQDKHMVEKYN